MNSRTVIEEGLRDPLVAGLDLSALGAGDLANLILQRSEVLYDRPRPGHVIRAWNEGDAGPIEAEVARLGPEIGRRAAAAILSEFRGMEPLLAALAPRRIADIGCGYAFFDLFAARRFGCDLLLIDLEANGLRHFGFAPEGAAYSSLAVARALLEANGVAPGAIRTLNPGAEDVAGAGEADLAVSLLSCGFHYPAETYMAFFRQNVSRGGAIILDLRARTAAAQLPLLEPLGRIEDLPPPDKARRLVIRKAAA